MEPCQGHSSPAPTNSQNAPSLEKAEWTLVDRQTAAGDTYMVLLAVALPGLSPWACPLRQAPGPHAIASASGLDLGDLDLGCAMLGKALDLQFPFQILLFPNPLVRAAFLPGPALTLPAGGSCSPSLDQAMHTFKVCSFQCMRKAKTATQPRLMPRVEKTRMTEPSWR